MKNSANELMEDFIKSLQKIADDANKNPMVSGETSWDAPGSIENPYRMAPSPADPSKKPNVVQGPPPALRPSETPDVKTVWELPGPGAISPENQSSPGSLEEAILQVNPEDVVVDEESALDLNEVVGQDPIHALIDLKIHRTSEGQDYLEHLYKSLIEFARSVGPEAMDLKNPLIAKEIKHLRRKLIEQYFQKLSE